MTRITTNTIVDISKTVKIKRPNRLSANSKIYQSFLNLYLLQSPAFSGCSQFDGAFKFLTGLLYQCAVIPKMRQMCQYQVPDAGGSCDMACLTGSQMTGYTSLVFIVKTGFTQQQIGLVSEINQVINITGVRYIYQGKAVFLNPYRIAGIRMNIAAESKF
jgi:hypothetical protein